MYQINPELVNALAKLEVAMFHDKVRKSSYSSPCTYFRCLVPTVNLDLMLHNLSHKVPMKTIDMVLLS